MSCTKTQKKLLQKGSDPLISVRDATLGAQQQNHGPLRGPPIRAAWSRRTPGNDEANKTWERERSNWACLGNEDALIERKHMEQKMKKHVGHGALKRLNTKQTQYCPRSHLAGLQASKHGNSSNILRN